MRVHKIRLKNIKSYGEGESGQGIFVQLEPGINQVAGKNGVGKSSLIEAIGYVLFDAEPVRGNARIAKNTYLLRNGCKAGEIDIWVWHQDCLYRVERDVGNGGRRWKVVRDDDSFIEAEGELEVKSFLADLAGVEGPETLPEVFHSLLGVKQGRFTIPFDMKPSEAKNHFDPLLNVDIFRQCFDYLKFPCDEIRQEMANQRSLISGLEGQLAQLQDAPSKLEEGVRYQVTLELLLEKCQEQLLKAGKAVEHYDALLHAYQSAMLQLGQAKSSVEQAEGEVNTIQVRVEEAKQSREIMAQTRADYQAYTELEIYIKELEKQRVQRDSLLKNLTIKQQEETSLIGELEARKLVAARDRESAAVKDREYQQRLVTQEREIASYQVGESETLRVKLQAEEMKNHLAKVVEWLRGMSAINKPALEQLADLEQNFQQIDASVSGQVAQAKEKLARLELEEQEGKALLERTRQDKLILEQQLKRLSGGQCPLLGTACNQFDPIKSREDLAKLTCKLTEVDEEHKEKLRQVKEAKQQVEKLFALEKQQVEKLARVKQLVKSIESLYNQLEDSSGREAAEKLALELNARPELPRLRGIISSGELEVKVFSLAVEEMKNLQLALYQCFQQWKPLVEKNYLSAQEAVTLRVARKKELDAEDRILKALLNEIDGLKKSAGEAEKKALVIRESLAGVKERLTYLEQQLKPFAELDDKLAEANKNKLQHLTGYTRYIQNQTVAARLEEYLSKLKQCSARLKILEAEFLAAEQKFKAAEAAYNAQTHQELKEEYARANKELGEATSKLSETQRLVNEQQRRVKLMDKLMRQRVEQLKELVRLQVQEKILEKARYILKNAQEPVAKNLTSRVAVQAQAIYNSMSNEAAQFNWRAADYSLYVTTVSGEKRFASLSGGQQMKAALAMQLALVKEFSTAGFCAFDEPTYGLDIEGRVMLAEAISKAQQECKFEQLLLVSHDQAFDDKVEYAINLGYSPAEGTKL